MSGISWNLIRHLVARDFRIRYSGSVLGVVWSVLIPMAQLGVLVFTFGSVVPVNIDDYPAFVYSALLPWTWFSACLGSTGSLFFSHRDLVRRPNFQPIILTVVNTLSNLVTFLLSLPLLFLLLAWYQRSVAASLVALPALLVLQAVMTVGLSLLVSTWNVFYRDVSQLVNIVLSLLFFLTPIFYRPVVESKYAMIFQFNPLAVLISSYRNILFEGRLPEWDAWAHITAVSAALLVCGYLVYRHELPDVVDTV
ncbi:MAG TPA: ABC transporter permease [Nitrospira sp.]|nr:ABC transporter permease [Nitrospira sp.]MCW5795300.1 ABC transporter permease [Nitrospira sp.]HMU30623.1 ABC transporter permease [Nitrospira sp.]HMV58090.1 ABC transporter permease [Nitrospira sp.]HMW87113.1 ABC transporter permease [Nitrospira sp.]